jgi:IS605 OrfB family transposase
MKHTKTLKVRIKDRHRPQLQHMAWSVNQVWNYVNELSQRSIRERGVFLSAYDIDPYTKGAGKDLGLHSQTLQEVSREYVTRRQQFKKTTRLQWRKSGGVRRSLGWVPFKSGAVKWKQGQVYHNGHHFKVWDSYGLAQYRFRAGSFSEDARGRWYLNVVVEVEAEVTAGQDAIGVDLGFKDAATCSDGTTLEAARFFRDLEPTLAKAQRARKNARVKAIHAKIANRRKDALHKFSRQLVNRCGVIIIGDVKSRSFTHNRKSAKTVYDTGWAMLKQFLSYKSAGAGIVFQEVNEAYTTQTCSCCGAISANSPKGRAGLGIRVWTCECGVTHHRDINAARNILALGHERLAGGIAASSGR